MSTAYVSLYNRIAKPLPPSFLCLIQCIVYTGVFKKLIREVPFKYFKSEKRQVISSLSATETLNSLRQVLDDNPSLLTEPEVDFSATNF